MLSSESKTGCSAPYVSEGGLSHLLICKEKSHKAADQKESNGTVPRIMADVHNDFGNRNIGPEYAGSMLGTTQ